MKKHLACERTLRGALRLHEHVKLALAKIDQANERRSNASFLLPEISGRIEKVVCVMFTAGEGKELSVTTQREIAKSSGGNSINSSQILNVGTRWSRSLVSPRWWFSNLGRIVSRSTKLEKINSDAKQLSRKWKKNSVAG
jgi:hypothetical protein